MKTSKLFFSTTIASEDSKGLNEHLGVFLNVKNSSQYRCTNISSFVIFHYS